MGGGGGWWGGGGGVGGVGGGGVGWVGWVGWGGGRGWGRGVWLGGGWCRVRLRGWGARRWLEGGLGIVGGFVAGGAVRWCLRVSGQTSWRLSALSTG